ncbi:hypothetical protein FA10DRAFT_267741 [Acaromyces ingoldii]|uniref:Uncharacterized protein n=1 Tax=Acaromyces ingoldii TaxID=215250 RepID=A0A316YN16_9BASI|nr:hypothetical protein FA10DRAFT_267741 [Acaromyces ingoldii]PWN89145.1 hypothetical protein FA10DRAFT_267741 [Acaromyces ingoldii]
MPSNQYRPLTKPYPKGSAHKDQVATLNRGLTIFAAVYLVVAFLSTLTQPSTSRISSPHLPSFSTSPHGSSSSRCNPFLQPGFVAPLPSGLSTYHTFDPSCAAPLLLPTLLSHLPSSPYAKSSIPPKQAIDPTLLASGLSNKTVVLIGDRVDQALVEHFCSLAGHVVDRVDARHPWAERLAPGSFSEESPLAHYCYVPEYDFFLTSVYHYGADQSFFFRGKPAWSATSTFEERVEKVIVPYLETTTKSFPASPTLPPPRTTAAARAPALVVLSSSFWDLAKFAQQDIDNLHSLVQDLDEERLLQWRSRHVDMLASLHRTFPRSQLAWRSLHAPASSERATVEWWTGTQKDTDAAKNHPLFHLNRIVQLNSALKSALYPHGDDVVRGSNRANRIPAGVRDLDWGNIMLGQDHRMADPVTPALNPGGSIFAEMLLGQLV